MTLSLKSQGVRRIRDEIASVENRLRETRDHAEVHSLTGERNSLIAELKSIRTKSVVEEIATERRRQTEKEGWSTEHDDLEHSDGELGRAAAAYALSGMKIYRIQLWLARIMPSVIEAIWPWEPYSWKPKGRRRNLVRAAALIVAEIERLDRAALRTQGK